MMYGTLTDDVTTLSPINNWTMTSVIRVQTGDSTHDINQGLMIDNHENHDKFYGWNHWAQKMNFPSVILSL